MNWISAEELALIHARVIAETGGVHGITSPGAIESALARPFTAFDGIEQFPDLVSKAAVLVHSVIAFHPFVDANKRTALVAADVCLRLNGWRLVPSDEVEPFFWTAASVAPSCYPSFRPKPGASGTTRRPWGSKV